MSVLAAAALAIVTQNHVSLRAAARESATQQAILWQGEVVEVRGERGDYLSVYDHRLERAGFTRTSQVRPISLEPEHAADLLAVVRFLRDTPGAESLGISYAAAYLKAASPAAIGVEPFDAIGNMADRLAQRASSRQPRMAGPGVAAQLEVVAQLGVGMTSFERDGSVQICYDGEMLRRVLAMPAADPMQRARAALALTRHECVDPALGPTARYQSDQWRAALLDRIKTGGLGSSFRNRVRMRRAGVLAELAFWQARRGEPSQTSADRALDELAAVVKTELDDADRTEYADAAVRVGASRLAAQPGVRRGGRLGIVTTPGATGETCVSLYDTRHPDAAPLVRKCTFGAVWPASASSNAAGSALTLAVQPLATWRELWVFHQRQGGWVVDILPPGSDGPGLGYIEFAGWEPGSKRFFVVREVRSEGSYRRRFEAIRQDTLTTEKQAGTPDLVPGFGRWQDAVWRSTTVALR